jgi:general secretion pathway protein D
MRIYLIAVLLLHLSFADEKINVNFKELEIRELLNITSKVTNKNILLTQNIKGKVDFISNNPITKQNLLELTYSVLRSKGYKAVEKGNIIRVVKDDDDEKIDTMVYHLKNSDSKKIVAVLNKIINSKEYKKFKPVVSFNDDTNSIIIMAAKSRIEYLKALIKKLDIDKQQVYVQARIIEVSKQKSKAVGIKYGLLAGRSKNDSGLLTMSANLGGEPISFSPSLIGLSIPSLNEGLALGATINLLNENGAANIISEPSLLCINNKESSIYVGETRSIKIATTTTDGGNINDTYSREDIGLRLKVKPLISKSDKVILQISTTLEDFAQTTTNDQPNTSKKDLLTTAIVNNGESVILGGYIKEKSEEQTTSVPVLGDIPILGYLFKDTNKINDKINLVIIVTPYIVPKNKDLTFIRKQLAELKLMEEKFTKDVISSLIEKEKDN